MNQLPPENDIPVLTDIIDEPDTSGPDDAQLLQQLQDALAASILERVSKEIPMLLEGALREHLPKLMSQLTIEVSSSLQIRLQESLKQTVAEEIARLEI